jgi:hypothetical protein
LISLSRIVQRPGRLRRIVGLIAVQSMLALFVTVVASAPPASASQTHELRISAPAAKAGGFTASPLSHTAQAQTRMTTKLDPKRQSAFAPDSWGNPNPDGTYSETEWTGGPAHTWTNYTDAGGTQGTDVADGQTIEVECVVQGLKVQDGNTNWYQIAQAPWNFAFYVSADPFYNNGATSGPISGTPRVDPHVPACGGGYPETAGSEASTWTDYSDAGGSQGPSIGGGSTVDMSCKLAGFKVADGNTWWYRIQQSPWNNQYYVSADAFYNNGQTSGSLLGTPFVDPAVPYCPGGTPPGNPGTNETAGGAANTWSNYTNAGGNQGQTVAGGQTIQVACAIQGFKVQDGNTWWYKIASSPMERRVLCVGRRVLQQWATSGSLDRHSLR